MRGKIRAAGVYGMEVEVIDGIETDLRSYARRLESGEIDALEAEDDEAVSGAFLGEQLRAIVMRAFEEGELQRIRAPMGDRRGRARKPAGCVLRDTDARDARRAERLSLLALRGDDRRRGVDPGGRHPVGGGGMLPDRQERGRPRRVPGTPLRRLVPAHHAGHVGARLPRYHRRSLKRGSNPDRDKLIPLTLGEVRRLLAHLITTIRRHDHIWRWSRWRRRHQYRARTSHYQRRLQT